MSHKLWGPWMDIRSMHAITLGFWWKNRVNQSRKSIDAIFGLVSFWNHMQIHCEYVNRLNWLHICHYFIDFKYAFLLNLLFISVIDQCTLGHRKYFPMVVIDFKNGQIMAVRCSIWAKWANDIGNYRIEYTLNIHWICKMQTSQCMRCSLPFAVSSERNQFSITSTIHNHRRIYYYQ